MDRDQFTSESVSTSVGSSFPTWERMDKGFVVSTLALVVALLPGIIARILSFGGEESMVNGQSIVYSPSFNAIVLILGLILGLTGMKMSNNNVSARTVAIFALIVCVVRILLQS
jgi:hypothetical protein